MGCHAISLSMGNSGLPFAHRRGGNAHPGSQLFLGHTSGFAQGGDVAAQSAGNGFHQDNTSLCLDSASRGLYLYCTPQSGPLTREALLSAGQVFVTGVQVGRLTAETRIPILTDRNTRKSTGEW